MDITVLQTLSTNFAHELQRASHGEASSLLFIKHDLPEQPLVKQGEMFQVIVIGGSVFRKARVQLQTDGLHIVTVEEFEQPPFLSRESFLSFFAKHVDADVANIGLNFAYPLNPFFEAGVLDGTLLHGSKENTFTGLQGEQVGKALTAFLRETTGESVTIAVANDVICLLLSGLRSYPKEHLAAGIMGTGTNLTFFHEGFAINLESANFNKFAPSVECSQIDAKSAQPGNSLFEKEVAGGYLYQHFNLLVKKQNLMVPLLTSSKELADVAMQQPTNDSIVLARNLLGRSASYFAAQLAGIAAFKQQPVTVILEGSFYWKNDLYKQAMTTWLPRLSPTFPVTIVHVDDSPIVGGAQLLI